MTRSFIRMPLAFLVDSNNKQTFWSILTFALVTGRENTASIREDILPCPWSRWSKMREANRRSTVEPGATEADSRSGEETYNHVNDGADGSHLGGSGVICGCEVLPVVVVCGDERQPGVLATQSHTNHVSRGRCKRPP